METILNIKTALLLSSKSQMQPFRLSTISKCTRLLLLFQETSLLKRSDPFSLCY